MNAKELVDIIDVVESISGQAELYGHEVAAERVCEAVDKLKQLVPRYRPPQPSDDGRYCFLEKFHKQRDCRPLYVALRDGKWQWYSEVLVRWLEFDGGVWPCERPESTT